MNIGFDAKRAFLNRTGLGNYSRSIISGLSRYFSDHRYYLYSPKIPENTFIDTQHTSDNILLRRPVFPFLKSVWRSRFVCRQIKKDKLDIYHGLSHELPWGIQKTGARSVVTIHDLIFFRFPEYYKLADRKIYEAKFEYSCRQADRIIAVSKQTKSDLINYLDVTPDKIEVLYQSCHPGFQTSSANLNQLTAVKVKYRLPDRYLLNVGTIEPRKNLLLIAKALRRLPAEIKCIVVGQRTAYFDTVDNFLRRNGLTDRMIFLNGVGFADLLAIYQAAEIFVYPSKFEGFGIPVLEAISSGVPVIAATGSCLEEAGGQGSLYVAPDDDEALAESVRRVWDDPACSAQMVAEGLRHSENFSEDKIIHQLFGLYETTVADTA